MKTGQVNKDLKINNFYKKGIEDSNLQKKIIIRGNASRNREYHKVNMIITILEIQK